MSSVVDSLRAQLYEDARKRAESAARAMTSDLKRTAPIGETGDLQRRTGAEVTGEDSRGVTVTASVDVPYAEPVVLGAKAHKISARNAQTLAFYWPKKGATVFFPSVNHPGNQPNPFFEKVVNAWRSYLESF